MRSLRIVAAALAVVVCAWFGLGIRQAHDLAAATAIINADTVSSAQAAHASSLLHAAGTLNPDRTVDILRGDLALDVNDLAGARRALLPVVKAEPENLVAWFALAQASTDDPRTAAMAYSALARLRPKVK